MEIIATEKTKKVIVLARDLQTLWDGIYTLDQDEPYGAVGFASMAEEHFHSLEKVLSDWVAFSIEMNMRTDDKGNIHI